MTSRMKLRIVLLAFVVLALSSVACNITPGDGQVRKAVIEGHGAIQDTADNIMEAVEVTGDGLEFETHESPIPALWDWAKEIAREDN